MKFEVVGDRRCDKCKEYILKENEITTVVLPNGRTRYFHARCLPPEDMKVLGKKGGGDRGPMPI